MEMRLAGFPEKIGYTSLLTSPFQRAAANEIKIEGDAIIDLLYEGILER